MSIHPFGKIDSPCVAWLHGGQWREPADSAAGRSWSLFVPPSVVERFYDAGLEARSHSLSMAPASEVAKC